MKYGLAIGWEPPAELAARMEGRNRFDMSPDDMAEVLKMCIRDSYKIDSEWISRKQDGEWADICPNCYSIKGGRRQ